jgi:tetratricopeptide (TPR) repeat protein
MELIERADFLIALQKTFSTIADGEGHCILLSGEAGIGKTSLIKTFCQQLKKDCLVYQSTCDALFTPRPLAPLYDIALQMGTELLKDHRDGIDRSDLFARFLHRLADQNEPTVLVLEDIHWADEATLDFIKFLARRIARLQILLILSFRDDEMHLHHPLRQVLGQLPPDSITRLQLPPLSSQSVEKMALEKGYKGEDIYRITEGNPFYVNEILASYSLGIPENIKDSILSVYNGLNEKPKQVWQLLSVLPTGLEIKYLQIIEPLYSESLRHCLEVKILVQRGDLIFFKHELYRRTIESALSPFLRVALNKKILDYLKESFEQHGEVERIVHHAKNANEYDLVVQYAPLAARQAAALGAHNEATKLFYSAIEYYQGNDPEQLLCLYESYAYECYLINQIKEAIIYAGKSLDLLRQKEDKEKIGNWLRFLSRLWWFEGNRIKADDYARQAIDLFNHQPSSKAKAMALSNMSQLNMLSDKTKECLYWGEKALEMASELNDNEVLCHPFQESQFPGKGYRTSPEKS